MTGAAAQDRSPRGSALDRFLRLFTDVRAGEGGTALILTTNVFIILFAYYVLKVLREPLVLMSGGTRVSGAEMKTYSAAGQALVLVILVPLYGALAGRVPRRRLINIVTGFFVACLASFYALARLGVPVGVAFYIWVGIFSLMIIAQFWSFANDLYTTEEGKRLFPIVAFGGSAGAALGSSATGWLHGLVGTNPLFLVVAALLVLAAVLTNLVDARERRRTEAHVPDPMSSGSMPAATAQIRAETGEFRVPDEQYMKASGTVKALRREDLERMRGPEPRAPAPSGTGAFGLVLRNPYLLLIALLMLIANCVNTTGEFMLSTIVKDAAAAAAAHGGPPEEAAITSFYAGYFTLVNLLSLGIQLFVVGRLIKFAGVRVGLLVLPIVAISGYSLMAFAPILVAMRWAKITENATDYSLQSTVRNVLFLPTTREEKYAAKQAIDGFFVRMGDVTSALLVFLGSHYVLALGSLHFRMQPRHYAMANMALIVVWMVLAVLIGRRYQRLAAAVQ